jgi:hypothetical protein
MKKNEIMSFAGKMDRAGDHYAKQDIPNLKRTNIAYSCSFVEPRPKTMTTMMTIIIGHECIW